jgi:hypothetical protein
LKRPETQSCQTQPIIPWQTHLDGHEETDWDKTQKEKDEIFEAAQGGVG